MSKPTRIDSALDRRAFLGAGALAGSALLAGVPISRPARAADVGRRKARNLIFAVSDGMSMGTLQMADMLVRARHGRPSHWTQLIGRPDARRALMDTRSADSIVTDSAAASTQWGTGEPAANGAIGRTTDNRFPEPILVRSRRAGKATGLVTTCRITHATPAGFIANIDGNRDDESPIAQQMLERRVDVLLGGGAAFMTTDMLAKESGLNVVRSAAELASLPRAAPSTGRLVGLFAQQHMDYELDRDASQPTLAQMTRVALERLALAPDGFVVQIEGGRVDHAAHSNDAGALIHDQAAFDDALGAALEWAQTRDDTLIIATTDHGNANPAVTDYGARGNAGFEALTKVRHSFVWIQERLAALPRPRADEAVRQIIQEATGVALESRDLTIVERWLAGEDTDPFVLASKGTGPLGSVLANSFAVAFLSPNHTSDLVETTAWGPSSELLPGFLDMRAIHRVMVEALDLPA